jgi:hypothetical protein
MNKENKPTKEMREYATEQMIRLVENMAGNPIEVYSKKEPGKDKQYFIGYQYKEKLIKQLKYSI